MNFYNIYHIARANKFFTEFLKNPLFQIIKDRFLRIDGMSRLRGEIISWYGYSFYFEAPYKIFYKAKNKGIENQICRVLYNNLRNSDTFIDVGANFGFISLVLSQKVSKVFSYELIPFISKTLQKTVDINNLSDKIVVENKAISDISNTIFHMEYGNKSFQTPSLKIDDYEKFDKVGAIKIDIDGDDYKVLIGASETIRKWGPVIIIELNRNPKFIYNFLMDNGYKYFYNTAGDIVENGDSSIPNLVASNRPLEFLQNLK